MRRSLSSSSHVGSTEAPQRQQTSARAVLLRACPSLELRPSRARTTVRAKNDAEDTADVEVGAAIIRLLDLLPRSRERLTLNHLQRILQALDLLSSLVRDLLTAHVVHAILLQSLTKLLQRRDLRFGASCRVLRIHERLLVCVEALLRSVLRLLLRPFCLVGFVNHFLCQLSVLRLQSRSLCVLHLHLLDHLFENLLHLSHVP